MCELAQVPVDAKSPPPPASVIQFCPGPPVTDFLQSFVEFQCTVWFVDEQIFVVNVSVMWCERTVYQDLMYKSNVSPTIEFVLREQMWFCVACYKWSLRCRSPQNRIFLNDLYVKVSVWAERSDPMFNLCTTSKNLLTCVYFVISVWLVGERNSVHNYGRYCLCFLVKVIQS